MAFSKTTQDHDTIRKWAEARGAVPAEVAGTHNRNEPGILRFAFPGAPQHKDSNLKEISWDEFFEKFDDSNLELVYEEKTSDGRQSNFNKLVHPSEEEHSSRKSGASSPSRAEHLSRTEHSGRSEKAGHKTGSSTSGTRGRGKAA